MYKLVNPWGFTIRCILALSILYVLHILLLIQIGYPINPKTIGEYHRKKRMDSRLMQSEVANIIGVSEESIWNWE